MNSNPLCPLPKTIVSSQRDKSIFRINCIQHCVLLCNLMNTHHHNCINPFCCRQRVKNCNAITLIFMVTTLKKHFRNSTPLQFKTYYMIHMLMMFSNVSKGSTEGHVVGRGMSRRKTALDSEIWNRSAMGNCKLLQLRAQGLLCLCSAVTFLSTHHFYHANYN